MQAEHLEILDFLRPYPPFRELPAEELEHLATVVDVGYFKRGSEILAYNQRVSDLHVVRSGSVEVLTRTGDLHNRLSEGGFFAEGGLLRNGRVRYPVNALEDTLIYYIPGREFNRLYDEYEEFADAVEIEDRERLKRTVSRSRQASDLMTSTIASLIQRDPIVISPNCTVRQAAELMTEEDVSSVFVQAEGEDLPEGVVTDKDLRRRVLAVGLSDQAPVTDIMSSNLVFIEAKQRIFEAMLIMLRKKVRHLPVLQNNKAIGVLTMSDLVQYESKSSLYVVSNIFKQNTQEELAALVDDVRGSFIRLVEEDANSRMIGSAMAVIGRSFKQRLIELAEEKYGPAPVPYCFLALGSMARGEQLIVTDQDNALVLSDRFIPEKHDEYFRKLAQFVSDGLDACGYPYCSGNIMATNPEWRQPLSKWKAYFSEWIDYPTPEGLLHSSIFFDLEGVWGRTDYANMLNDHIRKKAQRSKRFLACMARNALNRTPPLGFFRDFVMEKDGKHNKSINTKRRGTAPLADLIRVHALAVGSKRHNSFARLEDIHAANTLPKGRAADLRDALEFISMVRIRHQAAALQNGEEPNNNVAPDELSDFERNNLKDAFQILSNAQKFLRFQYPMGLS
ncbi:cyclic nucleotide-binding protein [Aliidiomarina taiwanensis]|uniref:Cyclic nucleotide-binding protein n=1 Tax=Aliidiomarina taiwanensis TaxID=946228 RepID=A0A432X8D4_9GAMM|nr:DUF294 nucleotidyltransferase-like domain-containing protein [Aliidiomarina taiwanensis]RUO43066.1 cyclic nucleotide-binding protein [Aliidiomarina taiwanensis]